MKLEYLYAIGSGKVRDVGLCSEINKLSILGGKILIVSWLLTVTVSFDKEFVE